MVSEWDMYGCCLWNGSNCQGVVQMCMWLSDVGEYDTPSRQQQVLGMSNYELVPEGEIEHKEQLDKKKNENIVTIKGTDFQISPSELSYLGKVAKFTQKLELEGHNFAGNHLRHLEGTKWANLKILALPGCHISDHAVTLLGPQVFKNVKILNLENNQVGRQGMRDLCLHITDKIEMMFLCKNQLADDGIEAIARSRFPKLEFLAVTENNVGPEGAIHLAKSPLAMSLKMIMLSRNQLGDKGVAAFAGPHWPWLQVLEISDNSCGPEGINSFVYCDMPCLRYLRLDQNAYRGNEERLVAIPSFPTHQLSMATRFKRFFNGWFGIKMPLEGSWALSIVELILDINWIQASGCRYLSKMEFPSMKILSLVCCRVSDEGVRELSKMRNCGYLERVNLSSNLLMDGGLKHLTKCQFKALEYVNVESNRISTCALPQVLLGAKKLVQVNWKTSLAHPALSNEAKDRQKKLFEQRYKKTTVLEV